MVGSDPFDTVTIPHEPKTRNLEAEAKADLRTLKSLRGLHHAKHELAHAKAPKP